MQVITICICVLLFFTISSIAEVVEVKKNDTIIEKSTSNVTEAVDLDGKDAETNSTIVEVQNDNNKTLNVSSLDESLNSQSETSEDNPKKRHAHPLPSGIVHHLYLDNHEREQRFAGNPSPGRNYPDYFSYNKGYADTIPGNELKDYPILSSIPETGFTCENKEPGLYGDIEARCQVWHFCQPNGRKDSFLCPNGTLFNQLTSVCEWWFNVECGVTSQYGSGSQFPSSIQYQKTTINLPPGYGYNKGDYGRPFTRPAPYPGTRRTTTYYVAPVTPSSYPGYSEVEIVTQPTKKPSSGVTFQGSGDGYYTSSQAVNIRPGKPYPTPPQPDFTHGGGYGGVGSGGDQYSQVDDGKRGETGYGVGDGTGGDTGYGVGDGKRGDTGYGVGDDQAGISVPATTKSGYQYSYTNYGHPGHRPGQKPGYPSQTGVQVPVQGYSGQKPGYPVQVIYVPQCGRCPYPFPAPSPGVQIDYRGGNPQYPFPGPPVPVAPSTPAPSVNLRPTAFPGTKSGYQYSYTAQIGGEDSNYGRAIPESYGGQKSDYNPPNPIVPVAVNTPVPVVPSTPAPRVSLRPTASPGTKSGYQYSYTAQIGGDGSIYGQAFSGGYGGEESGYNQPGSVVPVGTPVPRVVPSAQKPGTTKSGYQYSYSSDLSAPGTSYQQTFSGSSSGEKPGYQYPAPVGVQIDYNQKADVQGSRACAHCYIPSGSDGSSLPIVPATATSQNPATTPSGVDDDSLPMSQY